MNYKQLGHRALGAGDYQEAVNIFKRSLENRRDAEGMFGLAEAYAGVGDFSTARWAYNQALLLDPLHKRSAESLRALEKRSRMSRPKAPAALFRTGNGCFEMQNAGTWSKTFIKAINIGLGLPGYFPGEFPIGKHTYAKWFRQIADLGVNAIRIYTVHPPSFYEALLEFNVTGRNLFLFQGIWAELPEKNDFYSDRYYPLLQENIRHAVDVVYGNAALREKPGHAAGVFDCDVSRYTIGFIIGREWESCAVKDFNNRYGRKPYQYSGTFIQLRSGTPFEAWLAQTCDVLQAYEHATYHCSHPVSMVNWPTLDPFTHPSESPYEDELVFQGALVSRAVCNENEDVESVDAARFTAKQGGGFFATYHVYPYYPDFMNNDYPREENPYLAYLRAIKKHHGRQPIVIAEFGVPSSRAKSHWQKNGWHHGGHDDVRQGEINGLLMQSVYDAGMAGGALFSWFDEWFKRGWVFAPYELPAERNSLWFNSQDAEQNYGLLAAYPGYPGKQMTLSGRRDEWTEASLLYENTDSAALHAFRDGFDDARTLVRLAVQHDEGFLYIMLQARGTVDFSHAHYLIGFDTGHSADGEFLLPFGTNLRSPVGMKFLAHLAGEDKSRMLVCSSYDKYLNTETGEIRPMPSDQGAWVMIQNKTNTRRISRDKKTFYPPRVFSMSRLQYGSLVREHPRYHSLSDFLVSGSMIEMRIPWSLLNITDPSSRSILWTDGKTKTRKTDGINMIAVSYKPEPGSLAAAATGNKEKVTDILPRRLTPETIRRYAWEPYETPVFHFFLKESYHEYKKALSRIGEAAR